jgi:hypothetical protein
MHADIKVVFYLIKRKKTLEKTSENDIQGCNNLHMIYYYGRNQIISLIPRPYENILVFLLQVRSNQGRKGYIRNTNTHLGILLAAANSYISR